MDGLTIGIIIFSAIFIVGGIFLSHITTKITHKEIEEANKSKQAQKGEQ